MSTSYNAQHDMSKTYTNTCIVMNMNSSIDLHTSANTCALIISVAFSSVKHVHTCSEHSYGQVDTEVL